MMITSDCFKRRECYIKIPVHNIQNKLTIVINQLAIESNNSITVVTIR